VWNGQPRRQRNRGGVGELSLIIRPAPLLVLGSTYEDDGREKYQGHADRVYADIDLQACGVSGRAPCRLLEQAYRVAVVCSVLGWG
jgi:hypothetical protein